MAAAQKRLLTAETSKLGKVDIVALLKQDHAWESLPRATREHLYTLLPPAKPTDAARDPDVNPLQVAELERYLKAELENWQGDLREGREVKKWRGEGMQAGKDHVDGKFDEWKVLMREEYWGKPAGREEERESVKGKYGGEEGEKAETNGKVEGEGDDGGEIKDKDEKEGKA